MKSSCDGSYWSAVKSTLFSETLSMNAVMAGMIPVMVILMSQDMGAMDPGSGRFWGTMSLAFVVGTLTTYPVNWWLVKRGIKHGTGGEARARLSHSVSAASKLAATLLTLAMLAGGVSIAAYYGDFSMRAGDRMKMLADFSQSREAVFLPLSDITMAAQPPRQTYLTRIVNVKAHDKKGPNYEKL